jgi:sialidase-1
MSMQRNFAMVLLLTVLYAFTGFRGIDGNITVTEKQLQVPVLKYKKNNPVLQLTVRVNGPESPQTISGIEFSTKGTTRLGDIKTIRLFYAGNDGDVKWLEKSADMAPLAELRKAEEKITFSCQQTLQPGDNFFWLSYELNDNAGLLNVVAASCRKVSFKSAEVTPSAGKHGIRQRIGVALRQHNDDSVHTYRIPGLATTNKGTLLAIYDVRRESGRDLQGDIDIGVSRSTDGGNTWEPMRIAMDMGKWGGLGEKFNGVSDACILVDRNSDAIYIAGLWMHGVINEEGKWIEGLNEDSKDWNHQWRNKASQPGFDVKQTSQFLIVKSTDDGRTWSAPVNLTAMCKKEAWWLWAPAPGHGITLSDGTLVFPTQGRNEKGESFSNITYSKDGGKTWKTSNAATRESTTENMAVQLSDGAIMLNMRANKNRNDTSATNGRAVAITYNMGETWTSHPTSFNALREPTCMASIHRHDVFGRGSKKSVLLFSNPDSKTARDHMTIKVSLDNGNTWPKANQVLLDELKGRGYSCLTSINESTVGILYESSQADMVFQKIPLDELLRNSDR